MEDSLQLLDENSIDDVVASTSASKILNNQQVLSSDDEDDDFLVPLPNLDDPNDGEDYVPPSVSRSDKRKVSTEKDKKKTAAAEKRAEAKALKLAQQQEKKAIAEKKKNERLEQRLAKEAEKLLKKQHRQATRARQPKSLIKIVMIIIDNRILNLGDAKTFEKEARENLIEPKEPVDLEFVDADIPYSITWRLPESSDGGEPIISTSDLVIVLPVVEFINLVHGSLTKDAQNNLLSYFRRVKEKTQQKIILIILGLDGYLLNYKTLRNRQFRQQCGDTSANATSMKGLKAFDGLKSVISPGDIDRALVDLQMTVNVSHMNAADLSELAILIQHFTKAFVEKPEKKRKFATMAAIGWQELGSFKALKLGDDGSGRRELWKRLVQQSGLRQDPPFAEAVVGKYGNPRLLLQAYRQCENVELARNLLSQVEGGRRRYEASRRVHVAFTSRDPDQVIDRDK